MFQIIVATDFSEAAQHALRYACSFASGRNAAITVVHAFIIPVTFTETAMPVMPLEEGREIAEARMSECIQKISSEFNGLEIQGKVMYGDIVDCLEQLAEEQDPWITIMGNSGEGNAPLWLGSNLLNALKNLNHPVLAVPPMVTYSSPKEICFACDLDTDDPIPTLDLLQMVAETGARLHVLHIYVGDDNTPGVTVASLEALQAALAPAQPLYHAVKKENVEEGIQEFLINNPMDWLAVYPHKRSFFDRLFHKDHTKAIMKAVPIPLLAIHKD